MSGSTREMRVLHTLPYVGEKEGGGVPVAASALLKACSALGLEVELLSQALPGEGVVDLPDNVACHVVDMVDTSGFGYSRKLGRLLRKKAGQSDVVHSHGLWTYTNYASARTAASLGKPHLVTLHGSLEPWPLAHSRRKKSLVRRLFQDKALKNAACLHALSPSEADHIRTLGFKNPIAVIPNGIDLADYATLPPKTILADMFPRLRDQKLILFLSRIHPKKGLLHLVEAWGALAGRFADWHLAIVGPDEVGHRAEVERAVEAVGAAHRTTFLGALGGEDKLAALAASDVFVLPSFSEGFSMAVLEAMASGLPVLLTPACNFSEAARAGAAVEVDPNAESTRAGLELLLGMTDREREDMGRQGHRLVAGHYSWERTASELIRVYGWCLNGGAVPATVRP